jgi:hypothetical protein
VLEEGKEDRSWRLQERIKGGKMEGGRVLLWQLQMLVRIRGPVAEEEGK